MSKKLNQFCRLLFSADVFEKSLDTYRFASHEGIFFNGLVSERLSRSLAYTTHWVGTISSQNNSLAIHTWSNRTKSKA